MRGKNPISSCGPSRSRGSELQRHVQERGREGGRVGGSIREEAVWAGDAADGAGGMGLAAQKCVQCNGRAHRPQQRHPNQPAGAVPCRGRPLGPQATLVVRRAAGVHRASQPLFWLCYRAA